MEIKINISPKFKIPFISINSDRDNQELQDLSQQISRLTDNFTIIGYKDNIENPLSLYQISSFHTAGKKVVCESSEGVFQIRKRIYELINILPEDSFIQISSSEIISIAHIKNLSLTKSGIYQINLINGTSTYTSRRYMTKLRRRFLK